MLTNLVYCLLIMIVYLEDTNSSSCRFDTEFQGVKYVYDLTSMLVDPYQELRLNDTIMYISLCSPVEEVSPRICPNANSNICIVKSSNLNVPFAPNSVISNKSYGKVDAESFFVDVKSDTECRKGVFYSTSINFECSDENLISFLNYNDFNCRYTLKWKSPFACPVTNNQILDSCKFKDSDGYVFNLGPLRHRSYYSVQYYKRTFQINICAAVNSDRCHSENSSLVASCELKNVTDVIIGNYPFTNVSFENNGLKMTFLPLNTISNKTVKLQYNFVCSADITTVNPRLTSNSKELKNNIYIFSIETPLACKIPASNYLVRFNSNKYDLAVLNQTKNYEVHSDGSFFLVNILKPLVHDSFYSGGTSAAALVLNNGTIRSLGRNWNLISFSHNEVVITYRGGYVCSNGKRANAKINLHCSSKENQLNFIKGNDKTCGYEFNLLHYSACPIKSVLEKGCKIRDPTKGITFDLATNAKMKSDSDENVFIMTLCSNINQKCNGGDDVSICLKAKDKEIIIGTRNSQTLTYELGGLEFELTGENCRNNVKYKTKIDVVCDYAASEQSVPKLTAKDNCTYSFVWKTKKACPPATELPSCSVASQEGVVNLQKLRLYDSNYKITKNESSVFLLNVCGPLWLGRNEYCPNAAACIAAGNTFVNIGQLAKGPFINDTGFVTLKYESTTICVGEGDASHLSTVIAFVCNAQEQGPEYKGYRRCVHTFEWKTPLVCPLIATRASRMVRNGDCMTADPLTEFVFHLDPLKDGGPYAALDRDNNKFNISVCRALTSSKNQCGSKSGICGVIEGKPVSFGSANSSLYYDNRNLYLNYGDGDPCANGKNHTTRIKFNCCSANCPAGPTELSDINDCDHLVQWSTKFACNKVDCTVESNNPKTTYNLSVLQRINDNYVINVADTDVVINICKPINKVPVNCPVGSAACMAVKEGSTYSNISSLGVSTMEPVIENGTITLKYVHGSPCNTNKQYRYSSAFAFRCNPSKGVGLPKYQTLSDQCEHQFLWETDVVCSDTTLTFVKSNCTLINHQNGKVLDLSPAWVKGDIPVESDTKNYLVNLCSSAGRLSTKCNSALCSEKDGKSTSFTSYGQVKEDEIIFNYNYNVTTFTLTEGASCGNSNYNTTIRLRCSENLPESSKSATEWSVKEDKCNILLEWTSPAVCFRNEFTSSESDDLNAIRKIIFGVITFVLLAGLIAFFVYRYTNIRNARLKLNWSPFRSSNHYDQVYYSRVGATEEATLQLAGTAPDQPADTDSDEELLRLV